MIWKQFEVLNRPQNLKSKDYLVYFLAAKAA
jgi:hypothetical protein